MEVQASEGALIETMCILGIESKDTFASWLAAEKACLEGLATEPLEETLAMEYYQKLVNLQAQT